MSQRSLGLIETFGLLPAVEAADAAMKSANVLVNPRQTRIQDIIELYKKTM